MTSIYVARQPIFELGRGRYGYELLYRRDASIDHAEGDAGHMSAEVIVGALLGIGLRALSDGGVAFINFSRAQLLNQSWELFEPGSVMIELPETVECTEDIIAACVQMVRAGYRLALDDYVYSERSRPLLEIASVVKVDILGLSRHELDRIAHQLRPFGPRLLAERVETATVRDVCAELGYELFQGYLFSRPETLSKTDVSAGQLAIIRLLNLLQDPTATDMALEAAFQNDLALCYKLLRIVNVAAMGGRGVTSIPHAIRLVGRKSLHQWLSVILVASLGRAGDVSHELALTAMTRARMCELLAATSHPPREAASAFIVGLLSLLDVLLEIPMHVIFAKLELSDDVRRALLERQGSLAPGLRLAEAYEKGDWDAAQALAAELGIDRDALPDMYVQALTWAGERLRD